MPRLTDLTATIVRSGRRLSRAVGTGGAVDNVARRIAEDRAAHARVELVAIRLAQMPR